MGAEEFWLTTAPNPSSRDTGNDAGQRGWRAHAVMSDPRTSVAKLRNARAACGLVPEHGWGMDLFIRRRCARCIVATGGAICPTCHGTGMTCCDETGDARYMRLTNPMRPAGLEVRTRERSM